MIIDYIKSRLGSLLAWTIISVIFIMIFTLYELPVEAAGYGAAVSGFFGLLIMTVDFIRFRKKRKRLRELENEIIFTIENLPIPSNGVEEGYTELIKILFEEKKRLKDETDKNYADMTEYYTLWAHQIKTPIASMDLILQNSGTPEGRELSENLQRIEQYADMVMCYLRLNSDYTDYIIKEYDIDSIIRQAVRKFSQQFIRKKLKLTYEPIGKKAVTDEKWLLFVVEQVISNAVKYTKTGGVEIYAEEPLALCIKDTGIGIAPEDLPRIFDRGYTGCNGRLDKKASGIGLYLCKKICSRIGSSITAESREGQGTIIRITLTEKKHRFYGNPQN